MCLCRADQEFVPVYYSFPEVYLVKPNICLTNQGLLHKFSTIWNKENLEIEKKIWQVVTIILPIAGYNQDVGWHPKVPLRPSNCAALVGVLISTLCHSLSSPLQLKFTTSWGVLQYTRASFQEGLFGNLMATCPERGEFVFVLKRTFRLLSILTFITHPCMHAHTESSLL